MPPGAPGAAQPHAEGVGEMSQLPAPPHRARLPRPVGASSEKTRSWRSGGRAPWTGRHPGLMSRTGPHCTITRTAACEAKLGLSVTAATSGPKGLGAGAGGERENR